MNSAMRRGRFRMHWPMRWHGCRRDGATAAAGGRFDFAEELAEVVHPEAVTEQIAASPQRAEPLGGVARQARHGEQLHRALPQASEHAAQADFTVGTNRDGDQVGQCAVGRIAYHPHRRERQSVLGGECSGHMGFHVDGERAGGVAQGALCSGRHHRAVDAGDVGHDHALRMIRQARGETMSDERRSGVAAIRCGDAGRHDHVAGHQRRIKAAGNTDADDGAAIRLHPRTQQRRATARGCRRPSRWSRRARPPDEPRPPCRSRPALDGLATPPRRWRRADSGSVNS